MQKQKSFTLIEMLIVVVIIGILAAALIPRLQNARERTYDVNTLKAIRDIGSALLIYGNDKGDYPPAGIMTDDFATNGRFPLVPSYLSTLPEDTSKRSFEYGVNSDPALSPGSIKYNTRCNGNLVTDYIVNIGDHIPIGYYRIVGEDINNIPFIDTSVPNQHCTQHHKGFAYVALPKTYGGPTKGFALVGGVYSLPNVNLVGVPFFASIQEQYPSYNNFMPRVYFPYDTRKIISTRNEKHDTKLLIEGEDFPNLGSNTIDSFKKNLCRSVTINPDIVPTDSYMLMSGLVNQYYDCYVDGRGNNRSFLHVEVFE